MAQFCRQAILALPFLLIGVIAVKGAAAQDNRLPLLTNERGGPPIARWRVHAKALERLPQARKADFVARYVRAAQLEPAEVVVLSMVLRRVDLGSAARSVGMERRIPNFEQILRREQRAGEIRLTGNGPTTRLVPIYPPPGYYYKSTVKKKKSE